MDKSNQSSNFLYQSIKYFLFLNAFLRRLANVDHYLSDNARLELISNIKLFLDLAHEESSKNRVLPIFNWYFENNILFGAIRTKLSNTNEFESYTISAHSAITKNKAKVDFRSTYLLDKKFQPSNIQWDTKQISKNEITSDSSYQNVFRKLRVTSLFNYVGFYLDINLKLKGSNETLSFSTDVDIIPEYYPVADCHGEECLGTLV